MIMFEIEPISMMLAQEGQALPPVPGESPSAPLQGTTSSASGTPGPTSGGAPQSPFGNQFLLLMFLVVGSLIIFSLMGQRRDRKRRDAMISAIKKHDRVQTIGGVIGSVVEVKPDYVVLKVDESSNTRITFTRAAIQQVLSVSPDSPVKDQEQP